MMHSTALGRAAEEIAAAYLKLAGLRILDRNRRMGGGEIDLVAREGDCLVFVEVRYRAEGDWAGPARSIDAAKIARLRSCARRLAREPAFCWPSRSLRFDVVLMQRSAQGLRLWHHRQVRAAEALHRRRPRP